MSKFHGMLLFDIADKPIGYWHENLGGRGYYNKWECLINGKAVCNVLIEIDEDAQGDDCWECSYYDDNEYNIIDCGTYDFCIKQAKKWMRKHPRGLN